MSQARFQKQQREKQRRERAAAKFAKKTERRENPEEAPPPLAPDEEAAILASLADLHAQYDKGGMELEDFEAARDELTGRLGSL